MRSTASLCLVCFAARADALAPDQDKAYETIDSLVAAVTALVEMKGKGAQPRGLSALPLFWAHPVLLN